MKNILLTSALLLLTSFGFAQTASEPEYIGQVALLNEDNTLTVLPKESAEQKTTSSKWGMIPVPGSSLLDKSKVYLAVKGNSSPTKFSSKNIILIVRGKDHNEEPKKAVGIFKFAQKKKERRYSLAEAGLVTGIKTTNTFNTVPFKANKYGKASYLIELSNLETGEYGIVTTELNEVTTFSIQ